jgi:hypothetical protein
VCGTQTGKGRLSDVPSFFMRVGSLHCGKHLVSYHVSKRQPREKIRQKERSQDGDPFVVRVPYAFSFSHTSVIQDFVYFGKYSMFGLQRVNMLVQGSECHNPLTAARTQPARSPHVKPRPGCRPRVVSKCGRLTGGSSLVSNGSVGTNSKHPTDLRSALV